MGEQETIKYENLKTTPERELLEYCKVEMWLAGWTGCWTHLKREAASRKTEPVKIVNTQGNKDLESERKRVDSFSAHPSDSLSRRAYRDGSKRTFKNILAENLQNWWRTALLRAILGRLCDRTGLQRQQNADEAERQMIRRAMKITQTLLSDYSWS